MLKRWWRTFLAYDNINRRWYSGSAISYADFMDRPMAGLLGGLSIEQYAEATTESEEGSALCPENLADPPTTSDEQPRVNNVTDRRMSLEIARQSLNPVKKEKGIRAPGCTLVLLPETLTKLREEIVYYRKTGRIMPSTRRYTKPMPYEPAIEDFDIDTACLDRAYEKSLAAEEAYAEAFDPRSAGEDLSALGDQAAFMREKLQSAESRVAEDLITHEDSADALDPWEM
ncbi:MAG: hypothetical protein HQ546_08820 [Planctomycetes bacterium]|nr:hypothetical protein [Planctomycetota bacterium]